MGGVGGQFVEHDVERVCEFADLVVGTMADVALTGDDGGLRPTLTRVREVNARSADTRRFIQRLPASPRHSRWQGVFCGLALFLGSDRRCTTSSTEVLLWQPDQQGQIPDRESALI